MPEEIECCPRCGTPRSGDDRYCEVDGYDFVAGSAAAAARWELVATADREYYETVESDGIDFPATSRPRTFALDGDEVRIGRRSTSRGIEPEVDLTEPPEDTGISRLHAVLVRADDGSYALVDRGSTNGTTVNDSTEPIAPGVTVPLADGDRVHVGAWTTLTIRAVVDDEDDDDD